TIRRLCFLLIGEPSPLHPTPGQPQGPAQPHTASLAPTIRRLCFLVIGEPTAPHTRATARARPATHHRPCPYYTTAMLSRDRWVSWPSLQHTLRVPYLQALVDKPFCGGAAAVTYAVVTTAGAGSAAHVAVEGEEG